MKRKVISSKLNKETYEHKGSGYKGKGRINTDTATFNKKRGRKN